ncbi:MULTISPECIES: DUF6489 family protein [unclassified Neptuniibacter]|uniref:DUF6489 family protein n=1 Tax=unclassified Neptuniibacter TaxID=2630693 RepID=UPI0026E203D6|nr:MULTISPECIES: DUF6489 family protein [unclassified Neptuniibacter]MDO6513204.1 DUF6489 family protein [Neptuniibacter sp. 2_MG-2023]MDO6592384.1 DUF6489 family protein [Neptuniibacter sp. 1_MG-2023]
MKFKIDIDMSPEELRKVLGLPDVQRLQEDMMAKITERMESGVEGYDPLTLFKPYLTGGVGSMEALQKLMMNLMTSAYKNSNSADNKND